MARPANEHSARRKHGDMASHPWRVVGTCTMLLGLTACAGDRSLPSAPDASRVAAVADVRAGAATDGRRAEELAREIALGLSTAANRTAVIGAMHASRITREHKLQAVAFVRSAEGRALHAVAASEHPTWSVSMERLADGAPPLELYMPVSAHRNSWTGSDDVLVAVQVAEGDSIIAYDVQGTRHVLDEATVPTRPVIALVGAEADFRVPLGREFVDAPEAVAGSVGSLASVQHDRRLAGCGRTRRSRVEAGARRSEHA